MRALVSAIIIWCLTTATAQSQPAPSRPQPVAPSQTPGTAPPPAIRLSDTPMQVHLVRSGAPGCEPLCAEWIAAQGRIDQAAVGQFKKVLAQAGNRRLPVLIHSGGGSVPDAIEIGRLIRARGLDVAVGKTEFAPCAPDDRDCRRKTAKGGLIGTPKSYLSVCASACPFIVAGGTRRYVGTWALLGLHQITTFQKHIKVLRTFQVTTRRVGGVPVEVKRTLVDEKRISEKTVQTQTKSDVYERVRQHLVAMGIDEAIMPLITETPGTTMRWLKRPELLQLRMATDVTVNGEQLIAALSAPAAPAETAPAGMAPGAGPSAPPAPPMTAAVAPAESVQPGATPPLTAGADTASLPSATPSTTPDAAPAPAAAPPAVAPTKSANPAPNIERPPSTALKAPRPAKPQPPAVAQGARPSAPVYDFNATR
jgi:hypothetical protein